jgi:hypothetical protein
LGKIEISPDTVVIVIEVKDCSINGEWDRDDRDFRDF